VSLPLQPVEGAPGRFAFSAEPRWCSRDQLFGGAIFGALLEALERAGGQPPLSASAQFLEAGRLGPALQLQTEVVGAGRATRWARAIAVQDDRTLACASAALGAAEPDGASAEPLRGTPPPDACPAREYQHPQAGSISDTLDVRVADADAAGCRLWARWPQGAGRPLSAGVLGLLADHLPYAVRRVRGPQWYGVSVDAALRLATAPATRDAGDWVLLELRFDALGERFAHGSARLRGADGALLALGSQTLRLRRW
jgi:acyl-CoA thioesterase